MDFARANGETSDEIGTTRKTLSVEKLTPIVRRRRDCARVACLVATQLKEYVDAHAALCMRMAARNGLVA